MRGSWRPNRTATYWPLLLWPSVFLSVLLMLLNQRPGAHSAGFLYHILSLTGLISKRTDFLSSPSYMILPLPTQYLPITGPRDVSLPLSLEWHVWLSPSGNNCHAVHRSLSSGASVWLYCGILPSPILSDKPRLRHGICNFRVFGIVCLAGSKVNIQHLLLLLLSSTNRKI